MIRDKTQPKGSGGSFSRTATLHGSSESFPCEETPALIRFVEPLGKDWLLPANPGKQNNIKLKEH